MAKALDSSIVTHTDAVQGYLKCRLNPTALKADLITLSAHKINGPKGVGALYASREALKRRDFIPTILGGGQENGYRSGTENIFGIKVFEYAGDSHYKNLLQNYNKVNEIKKYIIDNINRELFEIISSPGASPYILTVSAKGLKGEVIMHSLEMENLIVGNGSACSSKHRYSRVLEACGYSKDILDGVIRLSFNPTNTLDEAKSAVEIINNTINRLKGILN
jgi:cysteine desulfurase